MKVAPRAVADTAVEELEAKDGAAILRKEVDERQCSFDVVTTLAVSGEDAVMPNRQ